ncbi:MAG TPA: hypothetical protein VKU62_10740 [Thermoanaerobaculia bacterium]|nr:hypothetical protein [Thermoanaerobaculia bacterium]
MSLDDLRRQLRDRGYLQNGIERWFALDPWSSRTFWLELTIVAAKAAILIAAFGMLPLVAIMLVRNHPLSALETLLMAVAYFGTSVVAAFFFIVAIALILKLRPALALDTPRALLGISFMASAILTAAIAIWWWQFGSAPSLAELVIGLALIVTFFLIATVAISAALLSFSIYELKRVPAIHQRPRGVPMSFAAAILIALLFLPAYASQERRAPEAPIQVVTSPTDRRIAFIAVDGLTYELATTRGITGSPVAAMVERSTTERWASVGTGVPSRLHGVHAVEGVRFRGGRHLLQSLSSSDYVLHAIAPAIGIARREPLPPTVRRRDFVWEIFAARGVPSASVNWWTTADDRSGALQEIGQEPIFAAAANDPLQLDDGAVKRLLGIIDRTRPRFATVYMPALDVILNRMPLDRTTQLAESVRALDGVVQTILSLRRRGYDVLLLGLPGDRQGGRGVLVSTMPLARTPASAYDVAPTLCAAMGFPSSAEMPGVPLVTTDLARIASYGPRASSRENVTLNDEYYQNLKSLGYIK